MIQRLVIIALIVLVFLAFMMTYTVRFNERAVKTTFGRADAASVITEPGLKFKIPYVQQVTKYDARTRFIQSDQETQQTLDNNQIIVASYITWRIEDPLKFFRRFSGSGESAREHYREAEKILRSKLRAAMSDVSKFRLDQLLAAGEKASKIADLEARILASVSRGGEGDAALSEYGLTPVSAGISGIALPQETTKQVFERMKASREKIANDALAQGTSQAAAIRASAESDAKKISSFANDLAQTIRNTGEIEAAEYLKKLNEDPKLAVFIQNMEFMRQAFGRTTTFVFPTSMPGFEAFRPDALRNTKAGELPFHGTFDSLTRPPSKSASRPDTDDHPIPAGSAATPGDGREAR